MPRKMPTCGWWILALAAGCDGPAGSTAAPDATASRDAAMDTAVDTAMDTSVDTLAAPDTAVDVPTAVDVTPDGAGGGCDVAWLRALRTPRGSGVSTVAAPGRRLEDLRAGFDADPVAMALLARARGSVGGTVAPLAPGDDGTYQVVASRALAAALVAWHDRDTAAAVASLRALEVAGGIDDVWLRAAPEVAIRVGGSLVVLAAAADLLDAAPLPSAAIDLPRVYVAAAANAVDAWLRNVAGLLLRAHADNQGLRLGAGLTAAAMVVPAPLVDDEVLAWGLAQMAVSIGQQTGGAEGWAEGSTYFAYGFEVAPVALAAVDAAWPAGVMSACVTCPGHPPALCAVTPARVVRPSVDPLVQGLARWGASLESRGGWLHPFDDSRLAALPAPLLEAVVGARRFRRWAYDGPSGSVGGSVDVGPLVALARAGALPPRTDPPAAVWPAAGTAHLEGTTAAGAALDVFVVAEHGVARMGGGHEHPDPLAIVLAVDGETLLAASGYGSYDTHAPISTADASSTITVEGVLPRALGAGLGGPDATVSATPGGFTAGWSDSGVAVHRAVALESDAVVVQDGVEVTGTARDVAWHWHLRGALDATAWRWSVNGRACAATQTGTTLPLARETAPHVDVYGLAATHPVVRQSVRLDPGSYAVTTRIVCTRP